MEGEERRREGEEKKEEKTESEKDGRGEERREGGKEAREAENVLGIFSRPWRHATNESTKMVKV